MDRIVQVLLVSGSLRARSTNTAALRTAAVAELPGLVAALYEGMGGLPHFNPDDDHEPLTGAVLDLAVPDQGRRRCRLLDPGIHRGRSPDRSRTSWTGP